MLTIHVRGKLKKEDYDQFVLDFERFVAEHGKVRLLLDMTNFHGWDAGAAWEDFKLGIEHFGDFERAAMVGEKKWEEGMAIIFKPFVIGKVRYFDQTDIAEARKWLSEASILGFIYAGGFYAIKYLFNLT